MSADSTSGREAASNDGTAGQDAASQAMCPACGSWSPWPPAGPCPQCGAPLTSATVEAIWDIDRHADQLQRQRRELVARLHRERVAAAARPDLPPPPPGQRWPDGLQAPATAPSAGSAGPLPPPPPRASTGLTGIRAQTVLGIAGVGLLALAALFFAAVTWQSLGPGLRVTVLTIATGAAATIAVTLAGRGLRSTGGAMAGLATVLSFVTVLSAERLDLLGDIGGWAGSCLGFVAATGMAWTLSGAWRRERDGGVDVPGMLTTAQVGWGLAVSSGVGWVLDGVSDSAPWTPVLAILAAVAVWAAVPVLERSVVVDVFAWLWMLVASVTGPVTVVEGTATQAAVGAAAGIVAAATWFVLARRRDIMPVGWFLAVSTATGLVTATVFRFVPAAHPRWTYAAVLASILMLFAVQATTPDGTVVPARWSERGPAIAGLWPAAIAGLGIAVAGVAAALGGLVAQSVRPWRPPLAIRDLGPGGVDDAVAVLGGVVVLMVIAVTIWERRTQRLTVASLLLLVVGAPAALWQVEAGPFVLWTAAIVPTSAIVVLLTRFPTWVPLPDRNVLAPADAVAALAAVGWIAESRAGTLVGGVVALLVVLILRHAGPRPTSQAVASGSQLVLVAVGSWSAAVVGVTAADLLGAPPVIVGIVASLGAAAGAWALHRGERVDPAWVLVVFVAQLLTVGVALAAEEPLAAVAAGFAAALGLFVVAMRTIEPPSDEPVRRWHSELGTSPATWGAIVHATLANAILLADRGIETVEAYTAVPAALMLVLGAVRLVDDDRARSVPVLLPGLLVFLVPTVLALAGDPEHVARALWLAGGSTALLVAGVRLRLSALMIAGAIGVSGVVLTQFAVVTVVVPSWVLFATLGVVLVTVSATYEARLRDVRRLRERIQSYR